MSGFDDIVLGGTSPPKTVPVQAPQHEVQPHVWPQQVVVQPAPPPRGGVPGWLAGVLAFVAVTFFMLWLSTWTIGPGPGPRPDPVDGAYAAIFYDDDDFGKYTDDQKTAISSAVITGFLNQKLTGWKKIDVDQINDEIKNLKPIYVEMADQHRTSTPWLVVRAGGRMASEEIKTPDQLMQAVERTLK